MPAAAEVGEDVRARHPEQRPPETTRPRAHRAQPAPARAAQQPQQHRLRLIVARVREGHRRGALVGTDPPQEGAALQPGGLLDAVAVTARTRGHVRFGAPEGHVPGRAEGPAERGIGGRVSRSRWSRWAATTRRPRGRASAQRACSRATESAPPDRALTIEEPGGA
jgi:hypothetical protein